MARPVILFSGQWADLPLEELAQKANEWGYQGFELCCWGDHFEVQRALAEADYCRKKLDLLGRHDLQLSVLASHRVGQAVCDRMEPRHKRILPEYVWGDGEPRGVQERAAEEMVATIRAAQKLGVGVVSGFTGSGLWAGVQGYPQNNAEEVADGLRDFAHKWQPILDVCQEAGVRFALEVHPGQIAFDLFSAEMVLDAIDGREEFGFTLDPSHLHWQGVDPVEFVRRFPDRIFHVHIKDIALTLNGRSGVLGSYLPYGDARRGWDFRSPGHGGLDWEALIRVLNAVGYDGPLAVEWSDAGMNRDFGAEEAFRFVKRLDFETPPLQ
ncbi:MAG TPA: sugar phosphate isomerase/epimerase [Gemmataceae bacterium]|jgi:sugar phosphate isomerase/epimerase|nr:sugar phosphate isomerase/epimerase [Gemmataceae bacterium]